jgi:hypothetical protein
LRWLLARTLRGFLLGFVGLLVIVAAIFLFAPTREVLLGWGIRFADDALPGSLTVESVGWPSIGHLVLEDVLWVSGSTAAPGDTLGDLAGLDLTLDLKALKEKDARIESLRLDVRNLDIPAIIAVTTDEAVEVSGDSTLSPTATAEIPYLRPGSLPGLPSAALSRLDLMVSRIRVAPGMTVRDLVFSGRLEAGHDRQAGIAVDHAEARFLIAVGDTAGAPVWEVTLDHLGLGLTLQAQGGDAGSRTFVTATLDSLNLEFKPTANPALQEVWRASGPMSLNTTARIEKSGHEYGGRLDCSFVLPGSAHFHPWLPEGFPHEQFGSVSGTLAVTGNYAAPLARGDLRLDLGSNSWLERGLIVGGAEVDVDAFLAQGLQQLSAHLDTLDLALFGARVEASGHLAPDGIGLDLEVDLDSTELPGLFAGDLFSDAAVDLQVEAGISGTLTDPVVDARLGGEFRLAGASVPVFDFSLEGDRRKVAAILSAGGGLEMEGTTLDSVHAEVRGTMAGLDSLSADFALAVWDKDIYLALGGAVRGDSVRVVQLDSLVLSGLGQEMRTRGPATLTLGPGSRDIELTALDIEGGLGSISAQGHWNDQRMDLACGVDLLLGEMFLQDLLPSALWSLNGGVDLKLDASADLERADEETEIVGQASARLLPHRDDPPFGIDLGFALSQGDSAGLSAEMALSSADTVLLQARLAWPGNLDLAAGSWKPAPHQDLTLTVPPQKLDLERINRRLPAEMALVGQFEIEAEVKISPFGRGSGVADSTSALPVQGSIDGSLSTPRLRVDMPNRSWIETIVDFTLTGPLTDPKLGGKVEVTSGFIRIPEIPRNLHPIEGSSLLWVLNDSLLAAMDTSATDPVHTARAGDPGDSLMIFLVPEQMGPALDPSGQTVLSDLDLEVVITEDLRIMGYGMDIKLGGNLVINRGFDEDNQPGPAIKGEIKVREGSLKVMNQVFEVERGNIKFTEAVPANPNLDLMLETQSGAYLVRILISGRAVDPVIELTSEPDLSEEDIMAVLLFGQPMNDLDNDQRGRMQEENDPGKELQKNLAGLAMAFGTKGLQDSMSDSFGVDMVQMGSDSSGDSTLMVGKFITPDIILKYSQSLEKSGTYFMNLEYSLNRYFKVISTYGQGEEASGAELRWSKRY